MTTLKPIASFLFSLRDAAHRNTRATLATLAAACTTLGATGVAVAQQVESLDFLAARPAVVAQLAETSDLLRRDSRTCANVQLAAQLAEMPSSALRQQSVNCANANAHAAAQRAELPSSTLRQQYLRCAEVSNERLLSPGEAVTCTSVADTLMQRDFGGDFNALIAWWQANRSTAIAQAQR